jgi:hypothetical protein
MRTTLNIDDVLLEKAAKFSGTNEKTALVRRRLEALVALESAKRLAALGGSEKQIRPVPRRRPARRMITPVDTSVRIDHLRKRNDRLAAMLEEGRVRGTGLSAAR